MSALPRSAASESPRTASPYRWVVEGLLFAIYMAFGLSWLAYSPLLKDLGGIYGVTPKQAADLISLVSISKAFVPLFAGWMASRLGVSRTLALGAGLAGLAVVAPLIPSFGGLLLCRFVFGMGGAVVVTLMGAQVMEWFPKEELPLVNGLNNVAVNTGITLSMFVTVPLAGRLGVQSTLLAYGTLNLALAALWAVAGRSPRPQEQPWREVTPVSPQSSPASEAEPASSGLAPSSQSPTPPTLGETLGRRETWYVALAFTGALALYLALNTWLPTYYGEAFGLDKAAAARLTALFNLVGIPTALFGGWLTRRLGLRRPLIILAGLMMPVASLGMVMSSDALIRQGCAAALGSAFFLYVAPLFTIPTELPGMDASRLASMTGVVFSVAYLASYASPKLVGLLREQTGSYLPGFELFAATSLLLALGGYLLPETGPGAPKS